MLFFAEQDCKSTTLHNARATFSTRQHTCGNIFLIERNSVPFQCTHEKFVRLYKREKKILSFFQDLTFNIHCCAGPVSQRSWVQIPYGPEFFQVLFTTTRFSSVLSCEDLLISSQNLVSNIFIVTTHLSHPQFLVLIL